MLEKIVIEYPYSSVNIETNRKVGVMDGIGNEYLKIQSLIPYGNRVYNIGDSIRLYDRTWASIK